MSQLHVHFALRNLQAFQRLLDNGAACSSPSTCDVNARDWLGRTVLHLVCASLHPSATEYLKLLLAHPAINVNLYDVESHWTALHRALYHGNIPAALLLLQRSDMDTALKDLEGYTAFDLYNSTLEGTKPLANSEGRAELFTWGVNRNASLGLGDADDRIYPDQVVVPRKDEVTPNMSLNLRFSPIDVRQVVMSRYHTVVVTSETSGNLRVCGFGNGGRLGHCQHTQYSLQPIPRFTHTIVSVALGQDHTLALTASGEVLSWGLNRFSQLGYVVECSPASGTSPDPSEKSVQSSPRKVQGALRKEFVKGVAASKSSSACWTSKEVFTWGTNNGQLGYDKVAQPVQVLPRKVTKVSQAVTSVSITDSAMACLLDSQEVVCIWNDRVFKLSFPSHFPSEIQVYRPLHACRNLGIAKITSCDDVFAAVSLNGELFTFTVSKPSHTDICTVIKPQRVWALRKKFTSVKDVALGADGSIIICTESGHVFVRSRKTQSWLGNAVKIPKFQRVNIQRVTNVCANNTGAFGAIRVDFKPRPIPSVGNSLAQDLAELEPYLPLPSLPDDPWSPSKVLPMDTGSCNSQVIPAAPPTPEVEDGDDVIVQKDITLIQQLFDIIVHDQYLRYGVNRCGIFKGARLPHGVDVIIETQQGLQFPVHGVIITARCPILADVISGSRIVQDLESSLYLRLVRNKRGMPTVVFTGCHAMSLLLLIHYLYTDDLPTIWDRRVAVALKRELQVLKINSDEIRHELLALGRILLLSNVAQVVGSPAKSELNHSLDRDMTALFNRITSQDSLVPTISRKFGGAPLIHDVILQLADKDLCCHSVILCARSVFFADFFNDGVWTVNRWEDDGSIRINMTHMKGCVMQFVLWYIYGGETIFTTLDFVNFIDEALEFILDVMAAANELLLDRLIILCSTVILRYTNINNACYILAEATHLNAQLLVESVHGYMAANMETLLESRVLDDVPADLIEQLAAFIRRKQTEKSPVQRSNQIVDRAMKNQSEWLALQDISQPIARMGAPAPRKHSPKLSTSGPNERLHRQLPVVGSPANSPTIRAQSSASVSGEDIFVMDETDPFPSLSMEQGRVSAIDVERFSRPNTVWTGGSSAPRVDRKTVMAEAAIESRPSFGIPTQRANVFSSSDGTQIMFGRRTLQQERGEQETSTTENSAGHNTAPTGLSRWRISPTRTSGKLADEVMFPSAPGTSSSSSLSRTNNTSSTKLTLGSGTKPHNTSQLPRTQPRLGPTFTPSRQNAISGPSVRRISGKAWTTPRLPIVDSSTPGSGASLVAIQESQLEQGSLASNGKRSLRQIQEEEQAHQMEADFLKWWSAEEERVKLEEQALLQQFTNQSATKPKGLKGKARGYTQHCYK